MSDILGLGFVTEAITTCLRSGVFMNTAINLNRMQHGRQEEKAATKRTVFVGKTSFAKPLARDSGSA